MLGGNGFPPDPLELSLGRRGDGISVLILDKLTLPSSPHLSGAQ